MSKGVSIHLAVMISLGLVLSIPAQAQNTGISSRESATIIGTGECSNAASQRAGSTRGSTTASPARAC